MPSHIASEWGLWWELLVVFGFGAAAIVAMTAATSRCIRSAVWQSALWRAATLSLFGIVLFELTGIGQGLAELCRETMFRADVSAPSYEPAAAPAEPTPAVEIAQTTDNLAQSMPAATEVASHSPDIPDTARRKGDSPIFAAVDYSGITTSRAPQKSEQFPVNGWPALVWAMGTVAVMGWMAWSRVLLWIFRRQCRPMCDEAIRVRLDALAAGLGIRRPVDVLTSQRLSAPVVLGCLRPMLVLPSGFAGDFNRQQQDAILVHELAHLASRDPAWDSAALTLCGLLWWHPSVWWLRRRLRAAGETAADEASLLVPDGPRVLAESLVLVGQRLMRPRLLAGLSIQGNGFRSGLGRRVERLLSLRQCSRRTPRRTRLAFVHATLPFVLALAIIFGTAWAPSRVPFTQGDTTMGMLKTSWRCSLAATALWALLGNNPSQAMADDQPADKSPPAATDRDQLRQQLQSMSQRIQQLEKEGKHDEAERLKREARELYTKMSPHRPEAGTPGSYPSNPEREKIRQQWLSLKQKAEQLEKEGKHDEAEHLKREVQELQTKLYPHGSGAGAPASHRPATLGEAEAKLQHLRVAAENLRAAGLGEQADNITKMMQRLQGEAREGGRPGAPQPNTASPTSPPREIMELRSEVQQMRREMQELREQLKRLIEQQGNRK